MRWLLAMVLAMMAVAATGHVPADATVSGHEGFIAFVSDRDGNREVYVMASDGSDQVNITSYPSEDHSPNWSPDGRQLVFVSDRSGQDALWTMHSDGSNPRLLIGGARSPVWSPDGSTIAFASDNPDAEAAIFLIGVDGTGLRRVVDGVSPAWFPDGSSILFYRPVVASSTDPTSAGYSAHRIEIASGVVTDVPAADVLDGSTDTDIAPEGASILLQNGRAADHMGAVWTVPLSPLDGPRYWGHLRIPVNPSFSPASDRWIGTGHHLGFTHVLVVGSDGVPKRLTDTPGANDHDPAWQPVNPYPMGLFDPATGRWHLRDAAAVVESFYFGNPGDVPFMGDWDCEGTDTPGLYRQSDGYVYLRNSNTQGIADISFYFGNPGDVPIAGDFDADGCDTVSIYRPSNQTFYIVNTLGANDAGLGAADHSYVFGNPGDKPFTGDFNGNGQDTAGLHRESTGLVYYRNTHTQGNADNQYIYGNPGDRFVTGDWNNDGTDTTAIYRPDNTTHYFRFTNTQGNAEAQYIWGDATWLPVTGTYTHNADRP